MRQCQQQEADSGGTGLEQQLRELLGRRLLRGGHGKEALASFRGTPLEEPARKYVEALERGRAPGDATERAQALFTAALLARNSGLELLGTEVQPDWALTDGIYDLGDWQGTGFRWYDEASPMVSLGKSLVLISQAERQRNSAHEPPHAVRFQYRSTAADLAEEAAALVPPRSQAYAALLCHAARFASYSEPDRVTSLWRTYVRNGAVLKERWEFGRQCPEPAFARVKQASTSGKPVKRWRRRHQAAALAGGLLVFAAGIFLLTRRRGSGSKSAL